MYRMTWEQRYLHELVKVKLNDDKVLQGVLMKSEGKYMIGNTKFTRDDLQYICKPCGQGGRNARKTISF